MNEVLDTKELEELIDAISGGIAARGFYVLVDEKLALLIGTNELHSPVAEKVIQQVATEHGWAARADSANKAVLFQPINAGR